MEKDGKTLKKIILTSKQHTKHPFTSQNTQQKCLYGPLSVLLLFYFILSFCLSTHLYLKMSLFFSWYISLHLFDSHVKVNVNPIVFTY